MNEAIRVVRTFVYVFQISFFNVLLYELVNIGTGLTKVSRIVKELPWGNPEAFSLYFQSDIEALRKDFILIVLIYICP